MQTKTVSTMQPMVGVAAGPAASLLLARWGVPVIQRLDGYMNGVANTQYWLQFFAGTTVPADTTKPLFELQVVGANGFSWSFGAEDGLDFQKMTPLFTYTDGLIVAVSSTSGSLTASAQTMDIEVTLNEAFTIIPGLSVAGDLTTGVQALTVWANGSYKALYSLDLANNDGLVDTQYLMAFTVAPTAGDKPLFVIPVADTNKKHRDFGSAGFMPFRQTAAYVAQNGLYLAVSTTAGIYTAAAGTPWTIRATYK